MVKKLFALASVTALTGLMAAVAASGCSSTTTVEPAPEAGSDARPNPRQDAAEEEVDAGPATCPTLDEIDTSGPFKSPNAPIAGACTEADLVAMEKVVDDDPTTTFEIIKVAASAACQACAFGTDGATWAAVVSDVQIGGKAETISNSGACVAIVSGKAACGKAFAEWEDCLQQSCADCASGSFGACFKATQGKGKACAPQTAELSTACGANVNTYISTCDTTQTGACTTCGGDKGTPKYIFEGPIGALCVRPPPVADGGSDGGDGG